MNDGSQCTGRESESQDSGAAYRPLTGFAKIPSFRRTLEWVCKKLVGVFFIALGAAPRPVRAEHYSPGLQPWVNMSLAVIIPKTGTNGTFLPRMTRMLTDNYICVYLCYPWLQKRPFSCRLQYIPPFTAF